MSGNPDIPLDEEAARFNQLVEEWIAFLRPLYTALSEQTIRDMAEKAAVDEWDKRKGRPH